MSANQFDSTGVFVQGDSELAVLTPPEEFEIVDPAFAETGTYNPHPANTDDQVPSQSDCNGVAKTTAGQAEASNDFINASFSVSSDTVSLTKADRDLLSAREIDRIFPDATNAEKRQIFNLAKDFFAPTKVTSFDGVIDQYSHGSVVGKGGQGFVVKLRDHGIAQDVAIKFATAEDNHLLRCRCVEERITTGMLTNNAKDPRAERITKVSAGGELESGTIYTVMEFCSGSTMERGIQRLHSFKERAQQSKDVYFTKVQQQLEEDLLRGLKLAADTIQYAHEKGYIHRDLKPLNIMVETTWDRALERLREDGVLSDLIEALQANNLDHDDRRTLELAILEEPAFQQIWDNVATEAHERVRVKVLDWGLAKQAEAPEIINTSRTVLNTTQQITVDGQILGTLQYMAPEQLLDNASRRAITEEAVAKADEAARKATSTAQKVAAADLRARAESIVALDAKADILALGGILHAILTGKPPFPGRDPRKDPNSLYDYSIPLVEIRADHKDRSRTNLRSICLKALHVRKRDRYDSAELLGEDIVRALDNRYVHAHAELLRKKRGALTIDNLGNWARHQKELWKYRTETTPAHAKHWIGKNPGKIHRGLFTLVVTVPAGIFAWSKYEDSRIFSANEGDLEAIIKTRDDNFPKALEKLRVTTGILAQGASKNSSFLAQSEKAAKLLKAWQTYQEFSQEFDSAALAGANHVNKDRFNPEDPALKKIVTCLGMYGIVDPKAAHYTDRLKLLDGWRRLFHTSGTGTSLPSSGDTSFNLLSANQQADLRSKIIRLLGAAARRIAPVAGMAVDNTDKQACFGLAVDLLKATNEVDSEPCFWRTAMMQDLTAMKNGIPPAQTLDASEASSPEDFLYLAGRGLNVLHLPFKEYSTESQKHAEKALRLEPGNISALCYLADTYQTAGYLEEALMAADQVLLKYPSFDVGIEQRASILQAIIRDIKDEASPRRERLCNILIEDRKKRIELCPIPSFTLQLDYTDGLRYAFKFEECLKAMNEAFEKYNSAGSEITKDELHRFYHNRGCMNAENGHFLSCIQDMCRAVDLLPTDMSAASRETILGDCRILKKVIADKKAVSAEQLHLLDTAISRLTAASPVAKL